MMQMPAPCQGERQKAAIARAIAVNPRVLFLDEPTSNIDISSAAEIEKYIRSINETQNTTIIMVTHNLFQAGDWPMKSCLFMKDI